MKAVAETLTCDWDEQTITFTFHNGLEPVTMGIDQLRHAVQYYDEPVGSTLYDFVLKDQGAV